MPAGPCNVQNILTLTHVHAVQARYRKEQSSSQVMPWIPPVDNLLKDSIDGSALGALLHFYCPELLPLDGKSCPVAS